MKKSTVGLIATISVVLFAGLSLFFIPFLGGISAIMNYMPNAALIVTSILVDPNLPFANGVGSCCVCIPIPLAFGIFALIQRANASALEGPFSHPDDDL